MVDELEYNVMASPVRLGHGFSLLTAQISHFSLEDSGIGHWFYATAVDELPIGNAQATDWDSDFAIALIKLLNYLL
jgi:hypothetical protein